MLQLSRVDEVSTVKVDEPVALPPQSLPTSHMLAPPLEEPRAHDDCQNEKNHHQQCAADGRDMNLEQVEPRRVFLHDGLVAGAVLMVLDDLRVGLPHDVVVVGWHWNETNAGS